FHPLKAGSSLPLGRSPSVALALLPGRNPDVANCRFGTCRCLLSHVRSASLSMRRPSRGQPTFISLPIPAARVPFGSRLGVSKYPGDGISYYPTDGIDNEEKEAGDTTVGSARGRLRRLRRTARHRPPRERSHAERSR